MWVVSVFDQRREYEILYWFLYVEFVVVKVIFSGVCVCHVLVRVAVKIAFAVLVNRVLYLLFPSCYLPSYSRWIQIGV